MTGDGRTLQREGDVGALYDRWSASYDEDENRTRDLAARALRTAGPDVAGRDVVELGCGTGGNTVWLAQRARSVVGMDISRGMLERARARSEAAKIRLIRHDVTRPLPLADGTADVVVITLVLEHVDDLRPVMAEVARVLRPDGEVGVCEYHPFRQLEGGQARFQPEDGGEEVRIPAYLHTVTEFVKAGLEADLELTSLRQWFDPDDREAARPRILSLRWRKP